MAIIEWISSYTCFCYENKNKNRKISWGEIVLLWLFTGGLIKFSEQIVVMHHLRIIHTDLKPKNILLVSPEYVTVLDYKGSLKPPNDSSYSKRVPKSIAIKVIDFGSMTHDHHGQSYIGSKVIICSRSHVRVQLCSKDKKIWNILQ